MGYEFIEVQKGDRVTVVTINRPQVMNAVHPLANTEFLFPFVCIVEAPQEELPDRIGSTLVVTAITEDRKFIRELFASPNVDRLNLGPIPTTQISWDQPHEGNLFEHLYRQRALQMAGEYDVA